MSSSNKEAGRGEGSKAFVGCIPIPAKWRETGEVVESSFKYAFNRLTLSNIKSQQQDLRWY
jgi:hypothetical protein